MISQYIMQPIMRLVMGTGGRDWRSAVPVEQDQSGAVHQTAFAAVAPQQAGGCGYAIEKAYSHDNKSEFHKDGSPFGVRRHNSATSGFVPPKSEDILSSICLETLNAKQSASGLFIAGQALKCLNGDKSNWKLIPRGMLPHPNGKGAKVKYDSAPNELKPALMAAARVEHHIHEAKK